MSKWIKIKKDDIDIGDDEINIYVNSDEEGSVYAVVKIEDIKEKIKEYEM